MTDDKRKEIRKILDNAKWILGIGCVVILVVPLLLTQSFFCDLFNFSGTGQIGDTIGGTTAPFLNLIGAVLIFYALKAQVKANELIQDQIDKDNIDKECENETANLNQLYCYLDQSVSNFKFITLSIENLKNTENIDIQTSVNGGDAFYKLFSEIRCHYHGTQEELFQNQSVSELYSILTIMELLLDKLKNSKSKNNDILKTLIKHQFDYKIVTRIRDEETESLKIEYCDSCECYHGLPDELSDLIGRIRTKLNGQ
jgi:hypothetical protein